MAEHIFLQRQRIEKPDLTEVLDLSATGTLEWGWAGRGWAAFGTNVDYSMGREIAVDRNLLEVRVGFKPLVEGTELNYVRMKDAKKKVYYVDEVSEESLLSLANRILRIGELALTIPGGRLSGKMENCTDCAKQTGHIALYNAVHGIAGAVLSGSERTECVGCGSTIPIKESV